MLIKLNCFSIKRNIYEDTASTADLLVFCKQADFLMSPPSHNLPFSARLLHLSYISILLSCLLWDQTGPVLHPLHATGPQSQPHKPLPCCMVTVGSSCFRFPT